MESARPNIRLTVGSHLIVTLHGAMSRYIAEVIEESPLVVKIDEVGHLSRIEQGRIEAIDAQLTAAFRESRERAAAILTALTQNDDWPMSGLRSLGLAQMTDVTGIDKITYPAPL